MIKIRGVLYYRVSFKYNEFMELEKDYYLILDGDEYAIEESILKGIIKVFK